MARRISVGLLPSGLGDLSINGNILTAGGLNTSIFISPVGTGIIRNTKDMQFDGETRLRFADSDSSNWVGFKAPATVAADVMWTLPDADGDADQVLVTNGAGTLSWGDAGIGVADQTSSTSTFYPLFSSVTSDVLVTSVNRASTKLSFVPSSGLLSAVEMSVTGTTASSDTTTGALVVSGGVGIGGNLTASTMVSGDSEIDSLGVGTPASGVSGEIRAIDNITAYYSSDIKFKENVREIPNALETVLSIGGKLFSWTDDYLEKHGGSDDYFLRKESFGVIAQDVQNVFPLAVYERKDDSLAVDYQKLCALAFAAIVELKKEVDELKGAK